MAPRRVCAGVVLLVTGMLAGCASRTVPVRDARQTDVERLEAQDPVLAGALADLRARPSAAAHLRVGIELMRLRVFDQAHDHLTAAIKKDSRNADAFDARARIWREWRRLRPALDDANRAVRLAPTSAAARNTLGTILFAMGVTGDAKRLFTEALTLDPTAAYAANNLCYLTFLEGDTAAAEGHCRQALALTPGLDAAHQNLALVYAATDISRAEAELMAGLDVGRARYNMGILRLARGEYALAATAFDEACAQRPPIRDACERAGQARVLAKGR